MKKKPVLAFCFLCILLLISSCGNNNDTNISEKTTSEQPNSESKIIKHKAHDFDELTNQQISLQGYSLSIPLTWEERNSEKNLRYFYPNGGMLMIKCDDGVSVDFSNDDTIKEYINGFKNSCEKYSSLSISHLSYEGYTGFLNTCTFTMEGKNFIGKFSAFSNSSDIFNIIFAEEENSFFNYDDDFLHVLWSFRVPVTETTTEPTPDSSTDMSTTETIDKSTYSEPTSIDANPEETTSSSLSIGQTNALSKAHDYLKFSSFSYTGLIEQLEFEGFSSDEAAYAVDNCGADWNDQALKKAKSYLDHSSFSYSGLVEQLKFEGFTSEQASYAVDNCSADWNEQAAKKAQSYLEHSSFSRQGLLDQLEFEGFTAEQAEYGVKAVGY